MNVPVLRSKRDRKLYVLETCWPLYEVGYLYTVIGKGAYKITRISQGKVRLKRTHYIWPPPSTVFLLIEFDEDEWQGHLRSGYARRYFRKDYGWWHQNKN